MIIEATLSFRLSRSPFDLGLKVDDGWVGFGGSVGVAGSLMLRCRSIREKDQKVSFLDAPAK